MAQVTIYLPDEVEAQARKTAKAGGITLNRWIAERVTRDVRRTWSPRVLAAMGAFPDFPELNELRKDYGKDAPRESLD